MDRTSLNERSTHLACVAATLKSSVSRRKDSWIRDRLCVGQRRPKIPDHFIRRWRRARYSPLVRRQPKTTPRKAVNPRYVQSKSVVQNNTRFWRRISITAASRADATYIRRFPCEQLGHWSGLTYSQKMESAREYILSTAESVFRGYEFSGRPTKPIVLSAKLASGSTRTMTIFGLSAPCADSSPMTAYPVFIYWLSLQVDSNISWVYDRLLHVRL